MLNLFSNCNVEEHRDHIKIKSRILLCIQHMLSYLKAVLDVYNICNCKFVSMISDLGYNLYNIYFQYFCAVIIYTVICVHISFSGGNFISSEY